MNSASRSRSFASTGHRRRQSEPLRAAAIAVRACGAGRPRHGQLRHDQRSARAGFGLAEARRGHTGVRMGDWSLRRPRATTSRDVAPDFAFDLRFALTQPVLLQGDGGFSRKGPAPRRRATTTASPHWRFPAIPPSTGGSARSRAGLARPRMVERIPGARRGGLGLDRHQPCRRRGADGVSDARPPRRHALAGRKQRAANGRTRTFAPDEIRFVAAAALAVAAHGSRVSGGAARRRGRRRVQIRADPG